MSENRVPDFMNASLQLSSEEFCRQLSVWFEDRGLISDLRAHLRSQMIAALRGTSIGAKPSRKTISPKFQAINLIIAEFLLQQEHHYTLSVFTSEVPLQEFTHTSVLNLSRGNAATDERLPRFHRRDLWDILETLGLSPDSEETNRVYNMYQENNGEALLTCIFRILPALSKKRLHKDVNESTDSVGVQPTRETCANTPLGHSTETNREISVETLNEEITNIINQSTVKTYKKRNLQDKINQLIKLERVRVQQDAEQKYERELDERQNTFQANLIQKENFFKKCLSQSEEKVLKEKKELEKGKKEIADVAVQLREGHAHITRSFNELQERQEILRTREVEMERLRQIETARFVEQANELDIQKRQLDQEFKRLEEEQGETQCLRDGIQNLRRNLDVANHALSESQSQLVVVNDLQQQCAYLRRELNSSKHYLKQLSSIRKNSLKQVNQSQQTDHRQDTLNDEESSSKYDVNVNEMYRQLQEENAELRARSHQQEERINELTTRATHLAMEVELAQVALASATQANTNLSSSDLGNVLPIVVHIDENPPPPPPPLPPRTVTPVPSYLGGGEDLVGQPAALHTVTPTQTQRPIETRETRRKPPRRLVIHTSTSSDESSPTDEVLQEARRRLRTLEEESAEVDRRFRDFKQRQASFFETAASVLSPGVQNPPPLSYRFSDLASRQARNYTPSVLPTFYGASSSGVPHSRHMDVLNKPSPINDIHRASASQLPSSIRQFTHANMTPSIDRITDIFRSSTSSESDSIHYLFSHQTPMPSSFARQSRRMETYDYDNTPHRNDQLRTREDSYPYKTREGLSSVTREAKTFIGANSESIKHKSEKVPFIPSSNIARSSQTKLSSPPKTDLATTVQPNITKSSSSSYKHLQEDGECNMTTVVASNKVSVLSRLHIVNNAVERDALQQVMLVDKTTPEPESETHESQGEQRTNMQVAKPDAVLPDACPVVVTLPTTSDSFQPTGVVTFQSVDRFRSTAQENTSSKRDSLLPQQGNRSSLEGASATLVDDKKIEITSSSNEPEHLITEESVVRPSSETQYHGNDRAEFREEAGTLVMLGQEQQPEQANMGQSGSGSTFALSGGKMSVSSIAMSSDSQSSHEQSEEPQSTQAPTSTIKIANVQINNAETDSDAHVTESQTSDGMSAPNEKDQNDDDFWT